MTKFSDLKGKTVIDFEGSVVGKIKDVEMNMINYSVQSIIIHKGFFRHDTRIMMEYIDKFEGDKVFLNISPVTKLIGKKVCDSKGQAIGKIMEVERVGETNVLENLIIKTKITLTKNKGVFEDEQHLPGEKMPSEVMRVSAESPLMTPSSDIEADHAGSPVETFKEEVTVSSKYIDSIGDHITLNVTREELFAELF